MNLQTIWYSIIVLSKTAGCFKAANKRFRIFMSITRHVSFFWYFRLPVCHLLVYV